VPDPRAEQHTLPGEFVQLLLRHLKFADGAFIGGDSDLTALGLDSMAAIELLFSLEDEFGVVVPDDRLTEATFATAGSLWAAVAELGAGAGEGERTDARRVG